MKFHHTTIPGLFRIQPFFHEDERGVFIKTFHAEEFLNEGLEAEFKESFYSESKKGVIRGMHFQLPPKDQAKLVFCTNGEIIDIIIDLRKDTPMFGKYEAFKLSGENREMLYIPKGCAHGFQSLSDNALVFYFTSTVHSKEHDTGIRYDSFGFDWPFKNPVMSARDLAFIDLKEFSSPF